jgi:hypothetical protein
MVRYHSNMKCHTRSYSAASQISFVFPPHKLFSRKHIYQLRSAGRTVILQATAYTHGPQCITSIPAHSDNMRVANSIDSHKSEDHDITDKLP